MHISKPRTKPVKLAALEALIRRLPSNHPKRSFIKQELNKRELGFRGERSIDYYIDSLSSYEDLSVIHDLRLRGTNGHFFQIDSLLLSPTVLIILEVKNLSGSLYLNPLTQQLIRTSSSSEEILPYPLLQTQMQKHQLKEWLISHHSPLLPVIDYVVISDPLTRIISDSSNQHLMSKMIHAGRLPEMIRKHLNKTSTPFMSAQKINELVTKLIRSNKEVLLNVCDEYKIHINELERGLFCPHCFSFSVKRDYGLWKCKQCVKPVNSAPLQALNDYYLLINPTLTNRDFRHFTNLTSPQLAHSILKEHCLAFTGTLKSRTYTIPFSTH
ncbi:NERD domain-containing protein [Alkalicoccobacillus gibsonii]|uniref:NERD domain-containing protein n=1 Tax=Alkalicoccobacillus gibsonii TaxID=79881 RepID=UPI001932ADC4|nr:NERD domain-containing protein [Alkalicoccobacillus gibsonii]MBM0064193.1 NERD domain-containing protein [Alkalicoccobacillus gibsonii]